MKRRQYSALLYSKYVRGFSLIELMVSLTIGLLISIAAFSAYLGAASASKITDAQGRMNEDAQAALSILTQQIRMAQNNPIRANRTYEYRHNPVYTPYPAFTSIRPLSLYSLRGCDTKFDDITKDGKAIEALTCTSSPALSPHSIAINYEIDDPAATPAVGITTDCLGNKPPKIGANFTMKAEDGSVTPVVVSYYFVENRFYIAPSLQGIPNLNCNGNGGSTGPQPLVENIEDLQFKYGTVSSLISPADITTAPVAGYLTAENVTKILPDAADSWARVITIRICVLVRSELPVLTDLASARYIKCDGMEEEKPLDLRMRRAYSTTVVLRNRRL